MPANRSLPAILFAVFLTAFPPGEAGALGSKDTADGKHGDMPKPEVSGSGAVSRKAEPEVVVKGRVRLVGTDLFSNLVITDEKDQDWYIEEKDRPLVSGYQQQTVTVKGRPDYRDFVLANGKKAGVHGYLLDISIVQNP
ncbi:MAG: hypothetical protein LBE10_06805 [Treponema sp.]|jgi:hypothetical protein|nr:hypothetical protein [Treponema sp.]